MLSVNRPIRLTQSSTQFKLFGNKTFCFRNFHTFKCECHIIMQIQYTKNLDPGRFELGTTLKTFAAPFPGPTDRPWVSEEDIFGYQLVKNLLDIILKNRVCAVFGNKIHGKIQNPRLSFPGAFSTG